MTVLVGVKCSDGILIGSDSIATSSMGVSPLLQVESNNKIQLVKDRIIVAATGSVGMSQRLVHHVESAITGGVLNTDIHQCSTNLSTSLLRDCQNSFVHRHPSNGLGFGALVALVVKDTPYLIEYDTVQFQPEIKEGNLFFVSMGSGQVIADPFLAFVKRVLWGGIAPTVETAMLGVYWVLNYTIALAAGGVGGPIKIAVMRKIQVDGRSPTSKWIVEDIQDLQQVAEYTNELESSISRFSRRAITDAQSRPVPEVPK